MLLTRVDAPIRTVTVYGSQALLKREAAFEAKEAGAVRLTLARLPSQVRDDSVRVRAGQGLVLLGSRVVARPVAESSLAALGELRGRLEHLDGRRRIAADAAAIAEATIAHVRAVQKAHATEAARWATVTPEVLDALLAWASKRLEAALQAKREADAEIREIDREKQVLEAKARELRHGSGVEKDIEVELEAAAAGARRVEVEYVTDGASWAPRYDFRADGDAKEIDVTYFGVVRQQTGEDWNGVKLALSTARPELGARPPELARWEVGIRPRHRFEGSEMRAGVPAAFEKRAAAPESTPAEEQVAEGEDKFVEGGTRMAAVEERGATVAFAIATPETIPSDGKEKKTTIGRQSFPAANRYLTAPKLAPFAYLRSTVVNAFPYPMLAGEANVFFGPDFVGRARADLVPPGEKAEIYLGVDERVKVERKTEKRFRDTTGLLSTDVRERFEFKIAVKNARDVPVLVTVLDQLPVSRDENVAVESVTHSIPPLEKDEKGEKIERGKLRWDLALQPRGEAAIKLGFTVRFPEKLEGEITGLER